MPEVVLGWRSVRRSWNATAGTSGSPPKRVKTPRFPLVIQT
jgi:hypothetical protein